METNGFQKEIVKSIFRGFIYNKVAYIVNVLPVLKASALYLILTLTAG